MADGCKCDESKVETSTHIKIEIPEEVKPNQIEIIKEDTPKKQNLSLRKTICGYFSEFMNNTTIHGLKYLVGNERSILEKIWWLLILSLSIYTCANLIGLTWKKWEENPVFIGISQTRVRLAEIPFPAVTVCPSYRLFNKASNYNFTYYKNYYWQRERKNFSNITTSLKATFGNASTFCNSKNALTEYDLNTRKEPQFSEFVTKVAPSMGDVFEKCLWRQQNSRFCPALFSPTLTDLGLCFSFNMLDKTDIFTPVTYIPDDLVQQSKISHWTFDQNYGITNETGFPRRAKTTRDFLAVLLSINKLDKIMCPGKYTGFYIILHHPAVMPMWSSHSCSLAENDHEHLIWIRPEITVASKNLKQYSPHRRKCFYSNEGHLKFFKIYTLENCKLECFSNYTLKECDCVPFYLPHENTTRICGKRNTCLSSVKDIMAKSESGILTDADLTLQSCRCLPSCTTITYNTEFVKYKPEQVIDHFTIAFKNTEFPTWERQELFGDVDFWASCGGLLGLFTGFSVVSIAEMIYYLSLRWVCKLRRGLWRIMQMMKILH